jgi:hypothetical protein
MKRFQLSKLAIALLVCLSFSTPAWAAYTCTGTVDSVSVSPGTGVVILYMSAGLNAVYLCTVDGSSASANGTVTPTQCKAFLSILMTAQASGRSVSLAFNDSLTCTTHDPWAWLTGWYYGPVLLGS